MAIPKRINLVRKVVSRFDPSWVHLADRRASYTNYCNTLDMEQLGDISQIAEPFTVFEIAPLAVSSEIYVDGNNSNWWQIFRTHVKSASGIELEFSDGAIKDKHRDEIGPRYIEDIARMIVELADVDGKTVFFTLPGGCLEFIGSCQRRFASEAAEAVRLAAAKSSS